MHDFRSRLFRNARSVSHLTRATSRPFTRVSLHYSCFTKVFTTVQRLAAVHPTWARRAGTTYRETVSILQPRYNGLVQSEFLPLEPFPPEGPASGEKGSKGRN